MLSRKCSNNEPKPKHRSLFQHYRSKATVWWSAAEFRSSLLSRHAKDPSACRKSADIVAKVFSGWRTKILGAAEAFYARRREGPYRFIQNRSRTSVVALKRETEAEKSEDQLSRDF